MAAASDQKVPKSFIDDKQISAIQKELELIQSLDCPILSTLGNFEIDRLRGGIADYIDLVSNKKVKVRTKIDIPSEQYPTINFVGKLMGPGASTLKNIQEQTNTKMTIRGIDSQKQKPNIIPDQCEKLHLQIDSLGTPAEAYYKLSHAVAEVQKCLTYNLPMLLPPVDPTAQNVLQIGQEFGTGPRAFPSPMRGLTRGSGIRRSVERGGPRYVSPPSNSGVEQNSTWLKPEEATNGEQSYNFGGPIHSERNPNRVAPY